jgi:periplasmic divalent cation tolerance protein
MKFNMVYITAKDREEAKAIGKGLVEERLAACVNIIDNVNSIYWWEGRVEDGQEAVLIAKTRESLVPELIKKVKSLHSYECPCIVSLPITDGNKDFLDWIKRETK